MEKKKVIKAIIMGAAGRDFHNFNVYFRKNPGYKVVAFTASQIPNIENRAYLGISIYAEKKLPELIKKFQAEEIFFAYSDISYSELMNKAAQVMAAGASFCLLSPLETMLKSKKPVIAVTAVRTGCGKSPVAQKIVDYLLHRNPVSVHAPKPGFGVVVVRHPMPYGNLKRQVCQRFAAYKDLKKQNSTIEEREEYEPYLEKGIVVFAGVDYEKILERAEKEADIIIWDGGNNDTPFFRPDLWITVLDAERPGHEISYYPGEINFRLADVLIINKVGTAPKANVKIILDNIRRFNPKAKIIFAKSLFDINRPELIKGKRVLAIEDGPTHTHGGMKYGAAYLAAKKLKAKKIVDPRPHAVGSIKKALKNYPRLKNILPATGYSKKQMQELEKTINGVKCDSVVVGTPVDLGKLLKINKPYARARYFFEEVGAPKLELTLNGFIEKFLKSFNF
jgi:predicted GTPase